MTGLPTASAFDNDPTVTEAAWTQALTDLRNVVSELPGGDSVEDLTIASGSVTPTKASVTIDTEASAAQDDLTNIDQTNHPVGRLLVVRAFDDARTVTFKHQAGGAGQLDLPGGHALDLNNTGMVAVLERRATDWKLILLGGLEDRHKVGDATDTIHGTTVPDFENSWTTPGGGIVAVQFHKNIAQEVVIEGQANKNPISSGTSTIFTLPASYRPANAWRYFPVYLPKQPPGSNIDIVQVTSAGSVVFLNIHGASSGLVEVDLSPIRFTVKSAT